MSGTSLLSQFSALEDPRQARKVVYPLPEILLLVLCATMAGAEDVAKVERWGRRKLDLFHAGCCRLPNRCQWHPLA